MPVFSLPHLRRRAGIYRPRESMLPPVPAQHCLSYHSFFMRRLSIPIGLALLVFQARPANNFALTIDNIMRGSALVGFEPSQVRWSADSERIYFQWKQATDKEDAPLDTYVVNRDGSGLRKLSGEEARLAPPGGGRSRVAAAGAGARKPTPAKTSGSRSSRAMATSSSPITPPEKAGKSPRPPTWNPTLTFCRTASGSTSRDPTICT